MDQPTNPYADPQITADAAAARARWERLTPEARTAFLVEIGILTPDLQLHPRYGGPTPPGVDAEAKQGAERAGSTVISLPNQLSDQPPVLPQKVPKSSR